DNSKLFTITLNVPGKHNVLNALASVCSALALNVKYDAIIDGISSFYGTHRRFEVKGEKNGITVVDDYAHHPTEIKATLNSAKVYPHKKIYCVFQPHTYSRTITLFDSFVDAFYDTDELILADIYAAREKDMHIVSSDVLGDAIRKKGVNCKNIHSFEEIVKYLESKLESGDLLLTVGAGDINLVGEMFLK
ncbi:MAG: cyanophycin synthetase, partial [Bacillota bacterium]|nr:cyanophycin synthetase [Bacillota bacterium]